MSWRKLAVAILAILGAAVSASFGAKNCGLTSIGLAPLNDLGPATYKGFKGGLYPDGSSIRPVAHLAAGIDLANNQIQPLDAGGRADPLNGRIVLISIGMSNTTQEFASKGSGAFKPRADADPAKNPRLVIVDCAQGGRSASDWNDPNSDTWRVAATRIVSAGVTAAQVQIAWVKLAERSSDFPDKSFPASAQFLQGHIENVLRILKTNYPNVRIAYLSSRTRAYTNTPSDLNPEPIAYESGFGVKWVIEDQISGKGNLNYDPAKGPVVAPYLSWGPYIWTDGTSSRSDGWVWLCDDTESDGIHPSPVGVGKVADQLVAFLKTDPTATPWFLKKAAAGSAPACSVPFTSIIGKAPFTVNFTASASSVGRIVEYAWTFDDGDFSLSQNPTKVFPVPGNYNVHLTVTDDSGNTSTCIITVSVTGTDLPRPRRRP
ncbi:MAG TPA: PKD domain-containing protein [Acidobacteriota bacterium]